MRPTPPSNMPARTSEELERLLQQLRNEGLDVEGGPYSKPLNGRVDPISPKPISSSDQSVAKIDRWHALRLPKPNPIASIYPTLPLHPKSVSVRLSHRSNTGRWHALRLPQSAAPAPLASMYPILPPRHCPLASMSSSPAFLSYRNENAGLSDEDALTAAIALS